MRLSRRPIGLDKSYEYAPLIAPSGSLGMPEIIHPIRFHQSVGNGRTQPSRVTCEKADSSTVEVIAKFSARCDLGVASLAMEVIAASLGADLGLPVATAYLLEVDQEWVESIADRDQKALIGQSNPMAFGSADFGNGFHIWSAGDGTNAELLETAAAIFAFDGFIVNPDRRPENPNCLIRGSQIRIFDHEAAFFYRGIIPWINPWQVGGLAAMAGRHIFFDPLKGSGVDLRAVEEAWGGLSEEQIASYQHAIPSDWGDAASAVDDAISLMQGVRNNIGEALDEVRRVLA